MQISQLLADAGLNQKTIKDMVEEEIRSKVDKAVTQVIEHMNAESSSGDFIRDRINYLIHNDGNIRLGIRERISQELSGRVIQIKFDNTVIPEDPK